MAEKKRVLIFTIDLGFGHIQASRALAAGITEKYGDFVQVDIVNPYEVRKIPRALHVTSGDYDRLVTRMPELYRFQYELTDAPVPGALMQAGTAALFASFIDSILKEYHPDLVIATHPMFPAPLDTINVLAKEYYPFFTLITDLTENHRLWFNEGAEMLLVPTDDAYRQAIHMKFSPERVKVTGIPVNPALVKETRSTVELRRELGWDERLPAILVVSSKRVKGMDRVLDVLNHSGWPMELIIVCGGDDALYEKLQGVEWHAKTRLYNFVSNLPTMLRACDGIIAKAGGLITTEALAAGKPIIFTDVTPGQEEGNANYVIQNEAGVLAESPLEALEHLAHWLADDGSKMRSMASKSAAIGRPNSSYDIADLIWTRLQTEHAPMPDHLRPFSDRFRDWLKKMDMRLEGGPDLRP
jgi:UDP-N-acetylglucosamine:LPS N-acetylglucosamine transferase